MKILMLTDRMESGGAETHVEMLTKELLRRGDEVEVFSGGGSIADRMERAGVKQYRFAPVERSGARFLTVRRMLKKLVLRERYDVLHAHTRTTALLMRGIAGSGKQAASVVTVHAAFAYSPLLAKLCYWGEKTIAVSEDLRARSVDVFGAPAEAITVVPNGVDCRVFCPSDSLPPWETVLFASRLDGDCALGAELLCEIAPSLKTAFPNLRIRIAGGGDGIQRIRELAEKANTVCKKRGFSSAVEVLGKVENMAAEYRRNRIFVGVSRAALEAAASGCAVILCGNEGRGGLLTSEAWEYAVSNFCCRGEKLPDGAWLEDRLRCLLANEKKTAEMAENARTWVTERYDSAHMTSMTEAVYEQLCQRKERSV